MSSNDKIQLYILKGLINVEEYCSKFIDKMEEEYFSDEIGKIIHGIKRVYMRYNSAPSVKQLIDTVIPKVCKGDETLIESCIDYLQESRFCDINSKDEGFYEWLVEETIGFIKNARLEIALCECVELMEQNKTDEAISKVIAAQSISFDDTLGTDYFEDIAIRKEEMKNPAAVIPTGIPRLDRAIGGGWRGKTLNIFGAATNVGKTLILGDISLRLVKQGLNGLYLTLEIAEGLLANRIDSNLSDVRMSELSYDVDGVFNDILEKKKAQEELSKVDDSVKPYGKFIVKEYEPGYLSGNILQNYIRDLQLKKGFKPDFIVVDYIGLMAPNGKSFSDNSYGKLKTVSEELRAVGCRNNIPIFTAVQINRSGFNTSHVGLESTADSIGIPQTADLMIMITRDENSDNNNEMYWNIAKSRTSRNGETFILEVDYDHMRLVDKNAEVENVYEDSVQEALERVKAKKDGA